MTLAMGKAVMNKRMFEIKMPAQKTGLACKIARHKTNDTQ
jgi:hypothetical protein